MKLRPFPLLSALLLLLPLALGVAQEEGTSAQADALLEEGSEHYYAGRLEAALTAFEAAAEIDRTLGPDRSANLGHDYGWIGEYYRVSGKLEQAIEYFRSAAALLLESGNSGAAAAYIGNAGWSHLQLGEPETAVPLLEEALKRSREAGLREASSLWAAHLAESYSLLGDTELAIAHNRDALAEARNANMAYQIYIVANNLAILHDERGEYGDAEGLFQVALEKAREFRRPDFESVQLAHLAALYRETGSYDEARSYAEDAASRAVRARNYARSGALPGVTLEEATVLLAERRFLLGEIVREMDRYSDAVDAFTEARRLWEEVEEPGEAALTANAIGETYDAWGRYEEALAYFEAALAHPRSDADKATYLNNVGSAYHNLGDLKRAREYYLRAMEIDEALGNLRDLAIERNNLGELYEQWGWLDQAAQAYAGALEAAASNGWTEDLVTYQSNLGTLYQRWGDLDRAWELIQSAQESALQVGDRKGAAWNSGLLGMLLLQRGEYTAAIEATEEALAFARQTGLREEEAIARGNLGVIFSELQENERARQEYEEAIVLAREGGYARLEASFLNNLGHLQREAGNSEAALAAYTAAREIAEERGLEELYTTIYTNQAALLSEMGRPREAKGLLESAVAMIEALRRTAPGELKREYLSQEIHVYQWLVEVNYQLGELYAAADAVEASRGRYLLEQLGEAERPFEQISASSYTDNLPAEEIVLAFSNVLWPEPLRFVLTPRKIQGAALNKRAFVTTVESALERELLRFRGREQESAFRTVAAPVSSERAREFAGPTSYHSRRWAERFETILLYYRQLLANPFPRPRELEAMELIGQELYTLLFDQTEPFLSGRRQITILADGPLALIPFETLRLPDGRYLVEAYEIRYIHSLSVDGALRNRDYQRGSSPLLAVGGAIYEEESYDEEMEVIGSLAQAGVRGAFAQLGYDQWANLPGSLAEVEAISTLATEVQLLTGAAASEEQLMELSRNGTLREFGKVHLAVHGVVVPEDPALSAVVLSQNRVGSGTADGYLTAGEIGDLELGASLVVLSACETALGKLYGGEGIVGLTQAFLTAGAGGVASSLWKVSDAASYAFMTGFYELMERDGLAPSTAATQMKRSFLADERYTHPFFWAPFIYYGMNQ